jgi:hypothetical protein
MERHDGLSRWVTLRLLALGESPHGHVVLHHGVLFELLPDGVCMVWACCLEKLLEVIGRLPYLVLEIMLGGCDVFLIRVISLLVVVVVVATSCNHDPLGPPFWPPLTAFGASLRAFADNLGWCPSATAGDHLPIALDEDGPNCLFTTSVWGDNVKQLLCGLWLITTEFKHNGPAANAGLECQDDVDVADLREFMALLRESPDVIPYELARLLLATLHIPEVAWPHVCALKVASEDLLEILPAVNRVS